MNHRTSSTRVIALIFILHFIVVSPVHASADANDREINNVAAFARLYGYVRYFHPSAELKEANLLAVSDWSAFVASGVMRVEHAKDPTQLAAALNEVFNDVAPGVKIKTGTLPAEAERIIPIPEDVRPTHAVYWHHRGHGRIDQGAYISERRSIALDAFGDEEPTPPAPGTALVLALGTNLYSEVPICLWADESRTFPHAPHAYVASNDPFETRIVRLAATIIAWNVFQHFYPYFDVVPNDWDGSLTEALRDASSAADDVEFCRVLQRMVAKLHDGHGLVLHSSIPRTHTLPLSLAFVEDRLVVSAAAPSISDLVTAGDIVLSIDGEPIDEVLADPKRHTSASTPQHMRFRLTQELIIGGEGTVNLTVERVDGTHSTVRIKRVERDASRPVEAWREPRPNTITQLADGIWYVNLDVVTPEEFRQSLDNLVKAKGIIFDLRGYPRQIFIAPIHFHIDEPSRSANWHVPIIFYPDRRQMQFDHSFWPVPPAKPRLTDNIVYITDGRAVSAAETYLAIAREVGADIIGEATAGTNGNINPIELPGGYRVIWTGMKVLKHDGTQHHGVGIAPTHPVQRTIAGVRAGKDEFLDAAINLVKSRLAASIENQ